MMSDMTTAAHAPEHFAELCETLYGAAVDPDQVWVDVVHKRSPDQADAAARRNQARVAMASNTFGAGMGALAIKEAVGTAQRKKRTPGIPRKAKIAAGLIAAGQIANVAGDGNSMVVTGRQAFGKGELVPTGKVSKAAPSVGADIKRMAGNVRRMWNPPAAAAPTKPPMPGGRTAAKQTATANQQAATSAKDVQRGRDIGTAMGTKTGKVMAGTIGAGGLVATNRAVRPPQQEYVGYGKRDVDLEIRGEFTKFDDAKRQAFGWASITKIDGAPVVDRQDDYIDIEDLETAAYTYVHKSRVGGDMHRRNGETAHKVSDMIESMVFTPEKIEKMGLPDNFPQGWWVGYQIHDEDTWQEVRKRGRTGFSIHGKGLRKDHDLDELMGAR